MLTDEAVPEKGSDDAAWMTGAFIAVRSDAARSKIMENLH
jgi:hypothetical protein